MLQVRNLTPFATTLHAVPDRHGVDTVFAVVKATFDLATGTPRVADEQVPIAAADVHHGDPATSSIRVPSDFSLGKPGTDALMHGTAWAPRDHPVTALDVTLRAGPLARTVRVFGDRHWETSPTGYAMTPPAPFVRMPLVWERAFGGSDVTDGGPRLDFRNPVGTGFHVLAGKRTVIGMPVPNLEDPAALISGTGDAPRPAAFAAIAPHWEPRRGYGGTYDEAWQRDRAPYLPDDFDPRFFHVAPPGLSAVGYFRGGEPVEAIGVGAAGQLRFLLPAVPLRVTYVFEGRAEDRPALLDTILLEPDVPRVVLVWRAALPCDKAVLKLQAVGVMLAGAIS